MIRAILNCDCGNRCEGTTGKCSSCNRLDRKAASLRMPTDPKPVNKVSESQSKLLGRYNKRRKVWIVGKRCAVHHELPAEDVHHRMGRVGYADEWARRNEIPLLIDERYWLPVSRIAHDKIEKEPRWAWENQYSFKRITDPIFRK